MDRRTAGPLGVAVQHMKLVEVALLPFGHVMREVMDAISDHAPGAD